MPKKSPSPSANASTPLWIQLYFVLGSLLGLFMLIVGSAIGLNSALTQYFFTPHQRTSMPPTP